MAFTIPKLIAAAKKKNIEVKKLMNGHYQLLGGTFKVNYYPHSRKKTAYVAGTYKSVPNVSVNQAIAMCFEQPKSQGETHRRSNNTRRKRAAMHKKGINNCRWCKKLLTLDTSTLEHIIPLASNGLDNANNRTLACEECNFARGCDMPELEN